MKKIIFIFLGVLFLTACSSGIKEDTQEAESIVIFPGNVNIFYIKSTQNPDNEKDWQWGYYKNGVKLLDYPYSVNYDPTFISTDQGSAILYVLKISDSVPATYNPEENPITIKTETDTYQTYDDLEVEFYNGIPIYQFCLKAEYNEFDDRNECVDTKIMYGNTALAESFNFTTKTPNLWIASDVRFFGVWDGILVYVSDYFYSIDLNSDTKTPVQISNDEDYYFSFMKDGKPVFSNNSHLHSEEDFMLSEVDVLLPERTETNVASEVLSNGEMFFLKKDDRTDEESEWQTFNLINDDIKVDSIDLFKGHLSLGPKIIDASTNLCSFPFNGTSLGSDPGELCVYGKNTFWITYEKSLDGMAIFMNGKQVELPEGWYIPSIVDPSDTDLYNPYLDINSCYETEECLVLESVSPVFGNNGNFGLVALVKNDFWSSLSTGPLYYLEYEDGVFTKATKLEDSINFYDGAIMK